MFTPLENFTKAMTDLYGKELADDRDRWKREALAARELLRFYGVLVQPLSKTDREARAILYRKARAANTPERTPPHAE
jgi:hypothetical protein